MLQQYQQAGNMAVAMYAQGQYRPAADAYLRAFWMAPTKDESMRWQIFRGYTSLLREKLAATKEGDFIALEEIADDKSEPLHFRTEGSFTLGLLSWDKHDREAAAAHYRKTIALGEGASRTMREKKVFSAVEQAMQEVNAGTLIDGHICDAKANVASMEHEKPGPKTFKQATGTRVKNASQKFGFAVADPPHAEELLKRCQVGGSACDHCGKTLQEVRDTREEGVEFLGAKLEGKKNTDTAELEKCPHCAMAYYCSATCRDDRWAAGHEGACRKPGQIEPRDFMRLDGLQKRPDLNGMIVEVQGPAPTQGRWQVLLHGTDQQLSVSGGSLVRLRPAE